MQHYQGYGYQQSYHGDDHFRNAGYEYQQGNHGMEFGTDVMSSGSVSSPCLEGPDLAASYLPVDNYTHSMHMKIRNATPAHLPADLHDVMTSYYGVWPPPSRLPSCLLNVSAVSRIFQQTGRQSNNMCPAQ